jgi:hypothetical protein
MLETKTSTFIIIFQLVQVEDVLEYVVIFISHLLISFEAMDNQTIFTPKITL